MHRLHHCARRMLVLELTQLSVEQVTFIAGSLLDTPDLYPQGVDLLKRCIDKGGGAEPLRELCAYYVDLGEFEKAAKLVKTRKGGYYTNPSQIPGYVHRELKGKPWWPTEGFPWVKKLEGAAERVKVLCEGGGWGEVGSSVRGHGADGAVKDGKWSERVVFDHGSRGEPDDELRGLLRVVLGPDVVGFCEKGGGEVIVSKLGPRSKIKPHCAPTNLRLTAHLGLKVPPGCGITVGGSERVWVESSCLVFDDSFLHSVRNDSDEDRVVLLVRFPHPDLADVEGALEDAIGERERGARRKWNPPTADAEFDGWCMSEAAGKDVCGECAGTIIIKEEGGELLLRCRGCNALKTLSSPM